MTKIRERAGRVLIVFLIVAFGGLWMLQSTGVFSAVGGGPQRDGNIIVVDGDAVSAKTYGQQVDQQARLMERRGRHVTPQMRDQIGERVYNQLVTTRLQRHEMDRLGITVTDDEVYDAVLGQTPAPIVKQVLRSRVPPQQLPQDGKIDREYVQYVINQPDFEPVVQLIEQVVRGQIRRTKLTALLDATVHVSAEDVAASYRRQNRSVDTRYVALPYAQVPDDAVSVSQSDLQSYYDDHKKKDYRRPKTYQVQYVTRTKQATQADTQAVAQDLESMRKRFAQAQNDSLFLARNGSENSFSSAYRAATALDPAVAGAVFPGLPQAGTIVGPVFAGEQAHLVKVTGTKPAQQPSVRVRHILFKGTKEGLDEARRVKQQITGGQADFAAMARQYSQDPASAQQGGSLGWRSPGGGLAPAFEEAAFSASPGQIVGPVKTSFGYHLLQVQARTDQQVQLADLSLALRPSMATLGDTEDMLRDVSVFTGEEGNFEKQAQRQNLKVQTASVTPDDGGTLSLQPIQALGPSQRLRNFLKDAEGGSTSDVIELDDQFAVVHVDDIASKGYRPLDDVRSQVEAKVLRQKKEAVQTKKLRQALDASGGDLDQLAQAVGTTARAKAGVTFDTRTLPALGNDAKFVGTALGLGQGKTSGVVGGENGAFVLSVTRVNEPPKLTDQKRRQLKKQLRQQKRRQMQQQWLAGLRKNADIQDNRAQYQ